MAEDEDVRVGRKGYGAVGILADEDSGHLGRFEGRRRRRRRGWKGELAGRQGIPGARGAGERRRGSWGEGVKLWERLGGGESSSSVRVRSVSRSVIVIAEQQRTYAHPSTSVVRSHSSSASIIDELLNPK